MAAYEISVARWPEDTEAVRALLTNYGGHLALSPVAAAGFDFFAYDAETRGLPGKYATGQADLLMGRVDGETAGCVAVTLRPLSDSRESAELKRLWVEPHFRGLGVGRGLVLSAIEWARRHDLASVLLDTVNDAMPEACGLYRSLGFVEIGRFNDNPVDGVRFYQLLLR